MTTKIFQVDAFTTEAFSGNPAGVCILDREADPSWMQGVAAEMNLSETAFLRKGVGGFDVRYYTPVAEVPLCGHATLASAHLLSEEGLIPSHGSVRFSTPAGPVSAHLEGPCITLSFPAIPVEACRVPAGLVEAIGAPSSSGGRIGEAGYLLVMASEDVVRSLRPDFARLRDEGYGGVIVTAESTGGPHDFVSRFFWPVMGIDEDPVTGVAHCSLGPYWAARLGKTSLSGHQVSKRGGVVGVNVLGDRVELVGRAVTVIRGEVVV